MQRAIGIAGLGGAVVRKLPGVDYEGDLAAVRAGYVTLSPSQRMKIIGDRIADDPYNGPNKLVTMVSAVEGFSRGMVVQHNASTQERMHRRYGKFRFSGPDFLVEKSLRLHGQSAASRYFGEDTWALFFARRRVPKPGCARCNLSWW